MWIDYAELTEIQLLNQIFVWINSISSSKHDGIFINESWENKYRVVKAAALHKTTSNHNPIIVECSMPSHRVSSFLLGSIWSKRDINKLLVSQFWERQDDTGSCVKRLARKPEAYEEGDESVG